MADINGGFTFNVWNGLFAAFTTLTGGFFLHKAKKLDDMPEKYVMKDELHRVKAELREDMKNNKDEVLEAIKDLHKRIDRWKE